MLLAVVIEVIPDQDLTLPMSLGRAAHALFLDRVRAVDPGLATDLHDADAAKPFTAACLDEGWRTGRTTTLARAGSPLHLRFTTLAEPLSRLLWDRVLPAWPERVNLDRHLVRTGRIFTDPADHPWAGRATHADLAARYLPGTADPPPRLEIHFDAPTTFRSRGRHQPLPLPDLVFGSLLDRWNAFAPVRLDDLREAVATDLAIARYRLETHLLAIGGGRQIGFTGRCAYHCLSPDPYLRRQAHLLAEFGFFGGAGHKTTMGLGRLRKVSDAGLISGRTGIHPPPRR